MNMLEEAVQIMEKAQENISENNEIPNLIDQINPNLVFYLFSSLGETYSKKKDYQNGIKYWQKSLAKIENSDQGEGLKNKGHILNNLGLAYYCVSNIQQAIQAFTQSLKIYTSIYGENDIQVANKMNNLAEAYRNNKEFEKALSYFQQSLEIKKRFKNNGNLKGLANTYQNIGYTYQNLKQYEQAIEFIQQSITYLQEIYENIQDGEGGIIISGLYNTLGECYRDQKQYDQSINFFEKAYEIKKNIYGINNKQSINTANNLASIYFRIRQYEKSLELFQIIYDFQIKQYGEQCIQTAQTLNNIGTVLCQLKNYKEGITKIKASLEIFQNDQQCEPELIERMKKILEQNILKQNQQEQLIKRNSSQSIDEYSNNQ